MRRRDDFGILIRTTAVLLSRLEPRDLAGRLVLHLARAFDADAALLRVDGAEDRPILAALRIEPTRAPRMADALYRRLLAARTPAMAWCEGDVPPDGEWGAALAARPGSECRTDGVVALLSERPTAFDADRDRALLREIAAQAGTAFDRARLHVEIVRRADRQAIRADQLDRLRAGLERHARSVKEALEVRNRFLATASHELRTPINAILGYNELLAQGVFGRLSARQTEIVSRISAGAEQLLTLVNDVLDLSKIQAGKLALERGRVDIRRLVTEAVEALGGRARAKGVTLRSDCPASLPHIETDTVRVRQILLNLLSNAIKFTDEGSVTARARWVDSADGPRAGTLPRPPSGADGWISIAVEDTGIGIPTEQIDAVFDEFVQVGTGTTGEAGTGLGLSISRRLARMLGGEITVESTLGVRSIFTLYLPCPRDAGGGRSADS